MPHVATQTRKFLRKTWYRIQKDIEELRRLKYDPDYYTALEWPEFVEAQQPSAYPV